MALNTLINNNIPSANILVHINKFYQLSSSFQKGIFDFFKQSTNDSIQLESIHQVVAQILEEIDTLDPKKREIFETHNIIRYIHTLPIAERIDIQNAITLKHNTIVGNRVLIESAILLLALLQLDEHKLKYAKVDILEIENNNLIIDIPKYISYNSDQESVLLSKELYIYKESRRKFYGLYLLFLKKIVEKLDGKIKIYTKNDIKYKIYLSIPVQTTNRIEPKNPSLLDSLKKRVLIYSNSKYISHKIKEYLEEHQFTTDIAIRERTEDKPPNFFEYDLLIVDSSLLDNRITFMLEQSKIANKKIIILADKAEKLHLEDITQTIVYKPFNYNELIFTILNIYLLNERSISSDTSSLEESQTMKQVIIADDDIINLKLLEYKFKTYNINVFTATNGEELLSILEEYGTDLIVVDSIMPKMNGYEVAQSIRKQKKYHNIPIIIHSSFSFDNYSINDIFHYGFDAFLPKPFTDRQFHTIVTRYLEDTQNLNSLKQKKQFYLFYKDIEQLIKEYVTHNQFDALISILSKLKSELLVIDEKSLTQELESILATLNSKNSIDSNLITAFMKRYSQFITQLKPLVS